MRTTSSAGMRMSLIATAAKMATATNTPMTIKMILAVAIFAAVAIKDLRIPALAVVLMLLSSHGLRQGRGQQGDLRCGLKIGGPAGGHTAGTLPDGTNIEMGGFGG